jgi:CHASE2 domain-containing sensor protein
MNTPKILKTKTAKVTLVAMVVLPAATLRAIGPAPIAQIRERSFDAYQRLRPRPFGH